MSGLVAGTLSFLCFALLGTWAFWRREEEREELKRRLSLSRAGASARVRKAARLAIFDRISDEARQAGLDLDPARAALLALFSAAGFFAAVSLIFGDFAAGVPAAPAGVVVVHIVLRMAGERRLARMSGEAAGLLTFLANALRGGLSLAQALKQAEERTPAPLRDELSRINRDVDLGKPAAQAFSAVEARVPAAEFRMAALATRIHAQIGGDLAGVYERIARTAADQQSLRRAVQAETAEGRLTGLIAGGAFFAIVGFLRIASPEYMDPLTRTLGGRLAVGLCCAAAVVGTLICFRMTDFKVE